MDCSLPGSSVHGIFQARVLEWVAISFSRRSSWPRDWTQVSRIVGRRFTVWATREVHWQGKEMVAQTGRVALSYVPWASVLSGVQLSVASWTVASQAPLSMGFPKRDYWSNCHVLLQGISLIQESNTCLFCLLHQQADSLPLCHPGSPRVA